MPHLSIVMKATVFLLLPGLCRSSHKCLGIFQDFTGPLLSVLLLPDLRIFRIQVNTIMIQKREIVVDLFQDHWTGIPFSVFILNYC